MAVDLMRGLKMAQIAKSSRIYIILRAQRVPAGWFLGPSKAPADQCFTRVSNVLLKGNSGSGCFRDRLATEVGFI